MDFTTRTLQRLYVATEIQTLQIREVVTVFLLCITKCDAVPQQRNVTVTAMDCRKPSLIKSFNAKDICRTGKTTIGDTETVTLIQRTENRAISAYRCTVVESHFLFYCGSYSHMKMSIPPTINEEVQLRVEDCNRMIRTQTHILRNGKAIPIDFNHVRHFKFLEHGSISWKTDNLYCEGADITYNDERHTNILLFVSGYVLVTEVTLKESETQIIDLDKNIMLEDSCLKSNACVMPGGTYVKSNKAQNNCFYHKIRKIKMNSLDIDGTGYLVSHGHKMLIKRGSETTFPAECRVDKVMTTQYPDLYISLNPANNLMDIQGDEINLDLEMRLTVEYLQYYTEDMTNVLQANVAHDLCEIKSQFHRSTDMSPFHHDHMIRRRGNIIQEFKCQEVLAVVVTNTVPTPHCFRHAIPAFLNDHLILIDTQKNLIINLNERIPISCDILYPDYIYDSSDTILLYANPGIRVEHDLHVIDNIHSHNKHSHETISKDLMYTESEITKFTNLIQFQRVKETVIDDFVSNICNGPTSRCGYNSKFSTPVLDWKNLIPHIPTILPLEMIKSVCLWAGVSGGIVYLSLSIFQILRRLFPWCKKGANNQSVNINIQPGQPSSQPPPPPPPPSIRQSDLPALPAPPREDQDLSMNRIRRVRFNRQDHGGEM